MTVTRENVRLAVYAKVETLLASYGALDVEFYSGKIINRATQVAPFLRIEIVYNDGDQIDIGPDGWTRVMGIILVEALAKEGTGVSVQNRILDHFYRGLHKTDSMPPVRTLAARFDSGGVDQGWRSEGAVIPFWYDTQ